MSAFCWLDSHCGCAVVVKVPFGVSGIPPFCSCVYMLSPEHCRENIWFIWLHKATLISIITQWLRVVRTNVCAATMMSEWDFLRVYPPPSWWAANSALAVSGKYWVITPPEGGSIGVSVWSLVIAAVVQEWRHASSERLSSARLLPLLVSSAHASQPPVLHAARVAHLLRPLISKWICMQFVWLEMHFFVFPLFISLGCIVSIFGSCCLLINWSLNIFHLLISIVVIFYCIACFFCSRSYRKQGETWLRHEDKPLMIVQFSSVQFRLRTLGGASSHLSHRILKVVFLLVFFKWVCVCVSISDVRQTLTAPKTLDRT